MVQRVAVIGAGYAGLACAVELAAAGIKVDVFEASRTLGGRARAVELGGLTVDNGAHILVGAYREILRLMAKVGAGGTASAGTPRKSGTALRCESLHLEFPGQVRIAAPSLPAPLHLAWALLSAQGLSFKDKLAAIRFMRTQQAHNFRLSADLTAAELFADQPEHVRRYLWEPLCLAALNTPVGIASAQVFLNVLRDSLAADRAASDLLLPATDFSSLFPEPAARYLAARGSRVLRSTRITEIAKVGAGWTASGHDETHGPYDHLILATAPYHLSQLLTPHPEFAELCRKIKAFHWQPIVTAYLAYPATVRLPFAMVGIEGGHAQWLFDRGALCGQHGLIAAVISGDGPHQALDHTELAAAIHGEIARLLPGLPAPQRSWVIEEKRATFACTPGLARPSAATAFPNVWLAGDYVAGDYPATLEGAVRSGVGAARLILRESPGHQP
ncbi:MAG: hydroxysqualene dehydroxylase HpnE [Rhodocyclaceae bacterium]|nr:hydroxysqualene dehydroxylase HpnE [Rhodocyclaceae bacterium]